MIALATTPMHLVLLIPNMVNPQYNVSGREKAEPSHLKEIESKEKRDPRCRLQHRGCSAMIINRPSNHSRLYQDVDRQVITVICAFWLFSPLFMSHFFFISLLMCRLVTAVPVFFIAIRKMIFTSEPM